jgi:hypothetical protein
VTTRYAALAPFGKVVHYVFFGFETDTALADMLDYSCTNAVTARMKPISPPRLPFRRL